MLTILSWYVLADIRRADPQHLEKEKRGGRGGGANHRQEVPLRQATLLSSLVDHH